MCNAPRCPPTVLEAEVAAREARCGVLAEALTEALAAVKTLAVPSRRSRSAWVKC